MRRNLRNLGRTGYIRARAVLYNIPESITNKPKSFALAIVGIPSNFTGGVRNPFLQTSTFRIALPSAGPVRRSRQQKTMRLFSGRQRINVTAHSYREVVRLYSLSWGVAVIGSVAESTGLGGGFWRSNTNRCPRW